MVETGPAQHLRTYGQIAWLWIRAAWQYPTSFVLLAVVIAEGVAIALLASASRLYGLPR